MSRSKDKTSKRKGRASSGKRSDQESSSSGGEKRPNVGVVKSLPKSLFSSGVKKSKRKSGTKGKKKKESRETPLKSETKALRAGETPPGQVPEDGMRIGKESAEDDLLFAFDEQDATPRTDSTNSAEGEPVAGGSLCDEDTDDYSDILSSLGGVFDEENHDNSSSTSQENKKQESLFSAREEQPVSTFAENVKSEEAPLTQDLSPAEAGQEADMHEVADADELLFAPLVDLVMAEAEESEEGLFVDEPAKTAPPEESEQEGDAQEPTDTDKLLFASPVEAAVAEKVESEEALFSGDPSDTSAPEESVPEVEAQETVDPEELLFAPSVKVAMAEEEESEDALFAEESSNQSVAAESRQELQAQEVADAGELLFAPVVASVIAEAEDAKEQHVEGAGELLFAPLNDSASSETGSSQEVLFAREVESEEALFVEEYPQEAAQADTNAKDTEEALFVFEDAEDQTSPFVSEGDPEVAASEPDDDYSSILGSLGDLLEEETRTVETSTDETTKQKQSAGKEENSQAKTGSGTFALDSQYDDILGSIADFLEHEGEESASTAQNVPSAGSETEVITVESEVPASSATVVRDKEDNPAILEDLASKDTAVVVKSKAHDPETPLLDLVAARKDEAGERRSKGADAAPLKSYKSPDIADFTDILGEIQEAIDAEDGLQFSSAREETSTFSFDSFESDARQPVLPAQSFEAGLVNQAQYSSLLDSCLEGVDDVGPLEEDGSRKLKKKRKPSSRGASADDIDVAEEQGDNEAESAYVTPLWITRTYLISSVISVLSIVSILFFNFAEPRMFSSREVKNEVLRLYGTHFEEFIAEKYFLGVVQNNPDQAEQAAFEFEKSVEEDYDLREIPVFDTEQFRRREGSLFYLEEQSF